MVEYIALMFVPMCLVEAVIEPHYLFARGTSVEMAIKVVAYKAMALLRQVGVLEMWPFHHFPKQSVQQDVIEFEIVLTDLNLCERCMVELDVALDRMIHYLTHLLEDTQHRFNNLQHSLELAIPMDGSGGLGHAIKRSSGS
jgi:hypothetical protein